MKVLQQQYLSNEHYAQMVLLLGTDYGTQLNALEFETTT